MSVDLKTLTPDTTINDSAVLFGADSQASSTPSVYAVSTVRGHIVGTENTFTQPQVISTSSSSAALRVTQTGAGNALLIEDVANPDPTPFVITGGGAIISGSPTAISFRNPGNNTSGSVRFAIIGSSSADINDARAIYASAAPSVAAAFTVFARSNTTTVGNQSIVGNGNVFGGFSYQGSDGVQFIEGARVSAFVDGVPGVDDMPGRLVFSTTADGASIPTERMRITNLGNVCIGTTAAGASAEEVLAIGTGVAPTTGPADTIQIYSTDLSAGNTMLSIYTEGTSVNANTTAAATHRIAVRINGTVYYLLANTAA